MGTVCSVQFSVANRIVITWHFILDFSPVLDSLCTIYNMWFVGQLMCDIFLLRPVEKWTVNTRYFLFCSLEKWTVNARHVFALLDS